MSGRLSALQGRILRTLAGALAGRWVLTGGAALGGFYTAHRTTRDLDSSTTSGHRGDRRAPMRMGKAVQTPGLQRVGCQEGRTHALAWAAWRDDRAGRTGSGREIFRARRRGGPR